MKGYRRERERGREDGEAREGREREEEGGNGKDREDGEMKEGERPIQEREVKGDEK